MIDNRLIFHTPNPILENIISSIPKINIDEYINNENLVNNIITSIYKNDDIDKLLEHFANIYISENEKCVLLGFLLAKTINNDEIKNIFNHLKWLDCILFHNNYVSESYFYYIKVFLEDSDFLLQYITKIKQYYQYCNVHPDKLFISSRFNKKNALKILEEWNNTTEYSKIIAGEWKNFYECLFIDNSYYVMKPLIETRCYKSIIELLFTIENFFILDDILSYKSIAYDLDFILELLNELKEENNKYDILKFLIMHKIQNFLTCLFQRVKNITDEIEDKISNILEVINNQFNKYLIYKYWLKSLTNQIIKNNEVDLSIILIEAIAKQLNDNNLIVELTTELLNDKTTPYENLMLLILLEDSPNFNQAHYELLKEYLLDTSQYIYVNLYQVNKAFEPRFYYLSQLFIGETIGAKEWKELWNIFYKERLEVMYPYFYKRNSKSMYRSIFLIITGIAAIQYICKENKTKASEFLSHIWEATKEIYLFNSKFYDALIVEIIFRLAILSDIIDEGYVKYLDFIKFNPSILTQVLTSLQHNGHNIDSLKEDTSYFESVDIYVNQLMNKKQVSKEYMNLCHDLYEKLKS